MPVDLSSAPTAPPRSTRAAKQATVRVSGKLAERREALEGITQIAGFGLILFKQYADAGALGMHSDPIINELVTLSDKNEKIAHALDYLTEAGPYAGLVVAVMPLALQIAANHRIVKAEYLGSAGVVPPEALESQVRADMARQAAEAYRQQQAAEAELAAIAAQMRAENPQEPSGDTNGQTPAREGRAAHK